MEQFRRPEFQSSNTSRERAKAGITRGSTIAFSILHCEIALQFVGNLGQKYQRRQKQNLAKGKLENIEFNNLQV